MNKISIRNMSKTYKGEKNPAVRNISLSVESGEIVTLLGPSGCGKTTTLRMISGFERPEEGTLEIDGVIVSDKNTFIPPEKRDIGMVFQDYALFPHLSIKDNVGFGIKKNKAYQEKIEELLELVKLKGYENKFPHELSGGQQQRVALARALARDPKVILFDEPFSNLDTDLRASMRLEVVSIIKKTKTTAIFVTHDQKEAMAISDRIVVMNKGKIEQNGTPRDIFECPNNKFVAEFMGATNIFEGYLKENDMLETGFGEVLVSNFIKLKGSVDFSIRPNIIKICDEGQFKGEVEAVAFYGDYIEVKLNVKGKVGREISLIIHEGIDKKVSLGEFINFNIDSKYISTWRIQE